MPYIGGMGCRHVIASPLVGSFPIKKHNEYLQNKKKGYLCGGPTLTTCPRFLPLDGGGSTTSSSSSSSGLGESRCSSSDLCSLSLSLLVSFAACWVRLVGCWSALDPWRLCESALHLIRHWIWVVWAWDPSGMRELGCGWWGHVVGRR